MLSPSGSSWRRPVFLSLSASSCRSSLVCGSVVLGVGLNVRPRSAKALPVLRSTPPFSATRRKLPTVLLSSFELRNSAAGEQDLGLRGLTSDPSPATSCKSLARATLHRFSPISGVVMVTLAWPWRSHGWCWWECIVRCRALRLHAAASLRDFVKAHGRDGAREDRGALGKRTYCLLRSRHCVWTGDTGSERCSPKCGAR